MVLSISEYRFTSNLFLKDSFGRKIACPFDKKSYCSLFEPLRQIISNGNSYKGIKLTMLCSRLIFIDYNTNYSVKRNADSHLLYHM